MAAEDFDLPAGRPVELHFADVVTDLHAIGPGVHAQSAPYGAGNTDEPCHAAKVVFRAEGDHAAKVCRGVDVRKVTIEHDVGLRADELQNHPWQIPIADEQVRASAEELVRNVVHVEQIQEIRETFVFPDTEPVRHPAD